MAQTIFANTFHPELFTDINNNGATVATKKVTYQGQDWIWVSPRALAYVDISNNPLNEWYLSFEIAPIPDVSEITLKDGVWSYIYRCVCFHANDDYHDGAYILSWKKNFLNGDANGCKYDGDVPESVLSKETPIKVYLHIKDGKANTITTSVGVYKFNDTNRFTEYAKGIFFRGVYVRNIIASSEPISFSDTLRDVPIDSIIGANWATSNGKSFSTKVNSKATVTLNKNSLNSALADLDGRKLLISGITNRVGEHMNALDVKYNSDTHQQSVDFGDHPFGTSWDITSSNVSNTIELTTRKVDGK